MNNFVKPILSSLMVSSIVLSAFAVTDSASAETKTSLKTEQKIANFTENSQELVSNLISTNDKLQSLNKIVYIVSYDVVNKDVTHKVVSGDTLSKIATYYNLNETALISLNKLQAKEGSNEFELEEGTDLKLGDVIERKTSKYSLNKSESIKDVIKADKLENAKVDSKITYKDYQKMKKDSMSSEISDKVENQLTKEKVVKDLENKKKLLEKKLEDLREKERKELVASGLSYEKALKQQLANEKKSETDYTNLIKAGDVSDSVATKYAKSLEYAEKLLGVPYVFGGTSEFGIDCSGYIYRAYNYGGISVPRTTAQGFYNMSTKISNPTVGDLVFFENTYKAGISHIGIYVGNGKMINAGGDYVHVADITTGYWADHFAGFGRLSQLN